MIVEPDFLSHWKTVMLIQELDDPAAPLYLIALWAHCQQRRTARFDSLPPGALRAICRYSGDAARLRAALERCGFIDADAEGDGFEVHGWAEANAKLLANWTNGPKGGRPRKNPPETHAEPTPAPTEERVPIGRTDREEKNRIEEKREERAERTEQGEHPAPADPQPRTHPASEPRAHAHKPAPLPLDLIRHQVNSLRPEWARMPHMTGAELHALHDAAVCLEHLPQEEWTIIRDYLAARLPEGSGGWQPQSRRKFLESPSDVLTHALQWHRKHSRRSPTTASATTNPVKPPATVEERKAAAAELRALFGKPPLVPQAPATTAT
ncbi:MAG: hypothetical protein QM755_02635 [Luteolibacter sp.]